jgi:hypothetical protein
MKRFLPLFVAVCAQAQSGIDVPAPGVIVDSSGSLRAVEGVAGSFLLGPAVASGVLSAACSEQLCLAKTASKILSATGEADAPPGPAIFGWDGDSAVVYFPQSQTLERWRQDALQPLDQPIEDEVLSIRVRDENIQLALRRDWSAQTSGPVLFLPQDVLLATDDQLILRHPDGSEMHFDLAGAETISSMGAHYAAIRAGEFTFLLRLDPGREQLFQLPGSAPGTQ